MIEKLKAIQEREKLTDAQMAERLGVHTMSWSRLKNKRSEPGGRFVRNAVKAFPELKEAAAEWLAGTGAGPSTPSTGPDSSLIRDGDRVAHSG